MNQPDRLIPAFVLATLVVLVMIAVRPTLPLLPSPIAGWPARHVFISIYLMAVGVVVSASCIKASDLALVKTSPSNSQELEWVFSPARASNIVERWTQDNVRGAVTRGVLIDTFAFIPFYVALLSISCFWTAGRFASSSRLHGYELALGWCACIAGALDLVENSGMLLELHLRWSFLAPLTASVAMLKWTLAILCALFSLPTLALLVLAIVIRLLF